MINFHCTCGQLLAAQDQDAGKMTACPKCGAHIPIPAASAIQSAKLPSAVPSGQADITEGLPPYRPAPEDEEHRHPRREVASGRSGAALASLILGLLSFCLPGLLSLLAIIFGFVGLAQTRRGKTGTGMAVTGLVTGFLSMVVGTVVLIGAIVYGVQAVRQAAARIQSSNNMQRIMLAVQGYHGANKKFPNHAIYSKDGKPLLSWRVAILPFMGKDNLYRQFKLNEPWDSPHNIKLLKKMPKIYANPLDPESAKSGLTHYQVFVGEPGEQPNTSFVRSKDVRVSITRILDGTSNTIAIVEAANAIPWTKPEDIAYSKSRPLPKLLEHRGVFLMGMFDGSVRQVRSNVPEQTLRNAITRDDGQILGPGW